MSEIATFPMPIDALPLAYDWEGGDMEIPYKEWIDFVTGPEWINMGIYKDRELVGWMGLQQQGFAVEYHVSTAHRKLRPVETQRVVIEAGKRLFQRGVPLLQAVPLMTNKPACRLAEACGMTWADCIIRQRLMHKRYVLPRKAWLDFPQVWG